jgi:Tat protein translocase TatB subunit
MFGVGYQEMFVILVIALVVFGPQRLPELAGQAGRWMREFKKMTAGLTGEFEKTMAEVDDIKQTVRREMQGMMDEVDDVAEGVKRDLGAPSRQRAAAGGNRAGGGGGGGGGNRGKAKEKDVKRPAAIGAKKPAALPVATKADPLSDVSLLDDDLLTAPTTKKVAANGSASTNGSGNGTGNGTGKVVAIPAADDALVRVRQRRAAAAYSTRR